MCLLSSASMTGVALAGKQSLNDSLKQNRNSGCAFKLASQSRCLGRPDLPTADGVPQMMMRPSMFVYQISVVRLSPVLAPVVMISMVRFVLSAVSKSVMCRPQPTLQMVCYDLKLT